MHAAGETAHVAATSPGVATRHLQKGGVPPLPNHSTLSLLLFRHPVNDMTMKGVVLAFLLTLALSGVLARRGGSSELRLEKPREELRTEGGQLEVWDKIRVLEDADLAAARVTLRQRGLLLPKYSDSATVAYVEEGEGVVGLLTGYAMGEASNVRRVRRGDVVAIPRGVPAWWYNCGNEDLRIIGAADTSQGANPGEYTSFHLIGGKEERFGGILQGFSRGLLAEAWNVDEEVVEKLLRNQRGAGIVKLDRDIRIPGESERPRERDDGDEANYCIGDYVYNVRESGDDIRVHNGGHLSVANRFKLPILRQLKLSVGYAHLEKNAILAPSWSPNGHRIVHFIRGNGHLEIVREGGEQLVRQEVKEGDVFIIPRFYPSSAKAGENGLDWVTFFNTDVPFVEALAGRTSVYKNLPEEVAAAAFKIDVKLEREIRRKREREAILLPGRGQHSEHSFQHEDFEESYLRFLQPA